MKQTKNELRNQYRREKTDQGYEYYYKSSTKAVEDLVGQLMTNATR